MMTTPQIGHHVSSIQSSLHGYGDITEKWVVFDDKRSDYSHIYCWDGEIIRQVSENNSNNRRPVISGDTVAWEYWDGSHWQIAIADITELFYQEK